jgi:hypothetical protein
MLRRAIIDRLIRSIRHLGLYVNTYRTGEYPSFVQYGLDFCNMNQELQAFELESKLNR